MKHPQSLAVRICLPCLIVSCFWPSGLWAEDAVIIGATQKQERFLTCVAQISADDLRDTPHSNERLTVVILEHQKFLEMREAFHAHKTKLAFSSLQARRIYLSVRMFRDFETLLRCITHELGHFATQSVYEGNAELAAERLRKTARQRCPSVSNEGGGVHTMGRPPNTRPDYCCKIAISNNVGGLKHCLSTLRPALGKERHFALVDGFRFPIKGSLAIVAVRNSVRPNHLFDHNLDHDY